MSDFLVIGESVADIVRAPGRSDVTHPGGSPANVAYGLARLGRCTALLTQLGADPEGTLIAEHLRSAGVEVLSDGQDQSSIRTPTAVATLDGHGSAEYEFDISWTLRRPERLRPTAPGHVHFGSIAAVQEPGASATLALVEQLRGDASVSYDPNVRARLMGGQGGHALALARVEHCVAVSDLVKASDQDLAWLYPGRTESEVAATWLALGPALVLITRGAEGAAAYSRTVTTAAPAVAVEVVDTVGAGDSFMSATLDQLASLCLLGATARPGLAALSNSEADRLLRTAGAAAAVTVSRAGARPPSAAELRALGSD